MTGLFRFLFKAFMAVSIAITSFMNPAVVVPNSENLDFDVLEYPAEAVKTLEEWGVTEEELKSRSDSDKELYESAQGYDDVNGVVISPYYTAKIAETDIPVYAATVFPYFRKELEFQLGYNDGMGEFFFFHFDDKNLKRDAEVFKNMIPKNLAEIWTVILDA